MDKYLAVLAGAGLGGMARYAAGTWIMTRVGGSFPWGTLFVNVTGSFVIGLLTALFAERYQPHPNLRLFLVTGVLGGYTTFSTFEYEVLQAVRGGQRFWGLVYLGVSVGIGYLAVALGSMIGARR